MLHDIALKSLPPTQKVSIGVAYEYYGIWHVAYWGRFDTSRCSLRITDLQFFIFISNFLIKPQSGCWRWVTRTAWHPILRRIRFTENEAIPSLFLYLLLWRINVERVRLVLDRVLLQLNR